MSNCTIQLYLCKVVQNIAVYSLIIFNKTTMVLIKGLMKLLEVSLAFLSAHYILIFLRTTVVPQFVENKLIITLLKI